MLIYPAIDLRGGQVVRLSQGDYDRMTVYSQNPVAVAQGFAETGAAYLHVVDLDGAKDGNPQNREVVRALCQLPLFVEMGGGMRARQDAEAALELGVSRVILGTAAITNFPLVEALVREHGSKIAVGVDTKNGWVATHGWQEVSQTRGVDFCLKLRDAGVETVIYTDVSKDGLLGGANLEIYETLSRVEGLNVIASGGVSGEKEIAVLRDMGLYGAIVGKALYAGKLSLKRALEVARGEAAEC